MTTEYKYNIFFNIEERGPEDRKGNRAKVLVDNEGYVCGIYSTYRQAKEAMPRIRRNLIREFNRREKLSKQ